MLTSDRVLVVDEQRRAWTAFKPLRGQYVTNAQVEPRDLARSVVVFARSLDVAHLLSHLAGGTGPRRGRLLLLDEPEMPLREALRAAFETVVAPPVVLLPHAELAEVLASERRGDLCVGGIVDPASRAVVLYRGDLSCLTIPLAAFRPSGDGVAPDPTRFAVADHGQTVSFGDYEAAFDALLYEWDADFRRRLGAERRATDRTFGASLRRLRKQRGLTRKDFPGIDSRTVARIETGEVAKPRAGTLAILAARLGVRPAEIADF